MRQLHAIHPHLRGFQRTGHKSGQPRRTIPLCVKWGRWSSCEPVTCGYFLAGVVPIRPLIVLLKAHREDQEAERATARQLWHDEGWVFATPEGRPLNPSTDYREWKELLEEAGLPERRLHDARHTAATVLAILAVPTPTAMAIMGWSSAEMAARFSTCSIASARAWPIRSAVCCGVPTNHPTRLRTPPAAIRSLAQAQAQNADLLRGGLFVLLWYRDDV